MSGSNAAATTSIFRSTFDIQERLGFGSFGDVFRVRSKLNQREYAVKKSRRVYIGEADRYIYFYVYIPLMIWIN
jgi:serine/threonine protein kinase